ncbi:MAG: energy-coupling factor transporter ATPase [Syntrophomonas sp.]
MIQLKKAGYSYYGSDSPALRDINLDIGDREFVAIMGRNASGKSTLARLFNGILLPTGGIVEIDGLVTADAKNLKAIRRKVALLLSEPDNQLLSNLVEEDVAFGPENLGLDPIEIRKRVDTALKMVCMEDYAKHPPYLLSGGQKQRVCIAGILAMKPSYMILDEPTAMLDPIGRREVMNTLLKLREEGIAIVLITHNVEEILPADRVVLMEEGCIKMECRPRELIAERKLLQALGLEPLEISSLIYYLNKAAGTKIAGDIYDPELLVEELCRLR